MTGHNLNSPGSATATHTRCAGNSTSAGLLTTIALLPYYTLHVKKKNVLRFQPSTAHHHGVCKIVTPCPAAAAREQAVNKAVRG